MTSRCYNLHLVKRHRNYTLVEIAALFSLNFETVRKWVKQGLPICDAHRPFLVKGSDLIIFLNLRRKAAKRPCGNGQFYCFGCKGPREPKNMTATYKSAQPRVFALMAECSLCGSRLNRHVRAADIDTVCSQLTLTFVSG